LVVDGDYLEFREMLLREESADTALYGPLFVAGRYDDGKRREE
jgi:hypothetical protein